MTTALVSNDFASVEDFLEHYGVKGMKWGERRALKREGRERVVAFNARANHVLANRTLKPISKKEYDSLPSKPVKLGVAGDTFNRFAANANLNQFAYVSKSEKDHNRYKAMLIPGGGVAGNQRVDLKIKVTKDLVSPSKKERIDTYIKTLDQDITFKDIDGSQKTLKGRAYLESLGMDHFSGAAAKALNNREFGLSTYNSFAQAQVLGTSIHQVYASNVKKKGYNALVDDADIGALSDLPIILFPKESGARVESIKPLTNDDIIRARAQLELV
jgi:hypothetical protein